MAETPVQYGIFLFQLSNIQVKFFSARVRDPLILESVATLQPTGFTNGRECDRIASLQAFEQWKNYTITSHI
jgi:hypothetical protein